MPLTTRTTARRDPRRRFKLLIAVLAFSIFASACGADATDAADAAPNSQLEVLQAELELQQAEIERLRLEQEAAAVEPDEAVSEAPVETTTTTTTTEPQPEPAPTTTTTEPPKAPVTKECDGPSFAIDGQDAGLHGGLRVEPSDGGSLSLWSGFGDMGVEVPLSETGQPGTELSTVSESGYRLISADSQFDAVDAGWYVSGTLAGPEGDIYPFESCLVPEVSGTWLYESFDNTGVSHTSWEMFDLATSYEWIGVARDQSELGEFERTEIERLLAFGDGFAAQEGFQLVQRIADGFNEVQVSNDELQQQASPLFHTWGDDPVSYLRISGGGDDAIAASIIRFEMVADDALGWVVGNVSTRAVCWRGVSDGFCI